LRTIFLSASNTLGNKSNSASMALSSYRMWELEQYIKLTLFVSEIFITLT
jgi:hypothetical protein